MKFHFIRFKVLILAVSLLAACSGSNSTGGDNNQISGGNVGQLPPPNNNNPPPSQNPPQNTPQNPPQNPPQNSPQDPNNGIKLIQIENWNNVVQLINQKSPDEVFADQYSLNKDVVKLSWGAYFGNKTPGQVQATKEDMNKFFLFVYTAFGSNGDIATQVQKIGDLNQQARQILKDLFDNVNPHICCFATAYANKHMADVNDKLKEMMVPLSFVRLRLHAVAEIYGIPLNYLAQKDHDDSTFNYYTIAYPTVTVNIWHTYEAPDAYDIIYGSGSDIKAEFKNQHDKLFNNLIAVLKLTAFNIGSEDKPKNISFVNFVDIKPVDKQIPLARGVYGAFPTEEVKFW